MTPGTILFDENFIFEDGEKGRKLFVVLNDGSNEIYICVKTTSNGHRYGVTAGCQAMDRFPNFFVPKPASCLAENTWIQLEVFYEFDAAKLLQSILDGKIHRIGLLDTILTRELITCATHSDDVTNFQGKELLRQLQVIENVDADQ